MNLYVDEFRDVCQWSELMGNGQPQNTGIL